MYNFIEDFEAYKKSDEDYKIYSRQYDESETWDVSSAEPGYYIYARVTIIYDMYRWNYDTQQWDYLESGVCGDEVNKPIEDHVKNNRNNIFIIRLLEQFPLLQRLLKF